MNEWSPRGRCIWWGRAVEAENAFMAVTHLLYSLWNVNLSWRLNACYEYQPFWKTALCSICDTCESHGRNCNIAFCSSALSQMNLQFQQWLFEHLAETHTNMHRDSFVFAKPRKPPCLQVNKNMLLLCWCHTPCHMTTLHMFTKALHPPPASCCHSSQIPHMSSLQSVSSHIWRETDMSALGPNQPNIPSGLNVHLMNNNH